MNTSSSTKTNLTIRGAVTGNPFAGLGWATLIFILITVSVFSVLVKLGLWQLERAQYKQAWEQTLLARQSQPALSVEQLQNTIQALPNQDQAASLTGYRLAISASPVTNSILLLDNQVFEGQVGYLVYQVFSIQPESTKIVVELGFIGADKDRRVLPQIPAIPAGDYTLIGRVYQKQANPLSEHLLAESGNPTRIQNLAMNELAEHLGYPVLPVVLQPDNVPHSTLPQPWHPIPLSAQKHQGYALQWFTMAAVFLGLMTWLAIKNWRQLTHKQ
ncbi:SURF1 family protein [Shewanella aestuarii]|uniref:SURF1-like protein n=1 Tax=Shewanella aestuarii TaxID=1028752 RepID=A0A6G9QGQ0_9GAMM|nr:SURF1 family protein [Shewanella aestuarii]QIR13245.1 SURF1 family protein [Shewanella aestuarii]